MHKLTKIQKSVASALDLRDLFVFGGLGSVGYGLWQINPIYAYIGCGAVLMMLGLGWLDKGVK